MELSIDRKHLMERCVKLASQLRYAVHELPAGVLGGPDGATPKECLELMQRLNEFEKLCTDLGIESATFIEGCRWHFEHYPHYLSRRRHFKGYASYIIARNGPLEVMGKNVRTEDLAQLGVYGLLPQAPAGKDDEMIKP